MQATNWSSEVVWVRERIEGKDLALPSSQIYGRGDSLLFNDHISTTHENLVIPSLFSNPFSFLHVLISMNLLMKKSVDLAKNTMFKFYLLVFSHDSQWRCLLAIQWWRGACECSSTAHKNLAAIAFYNPFSLYPIHRP